MRPPIERYAELAARATPGPWVGQCSTDDYGEDTTDIKSKWPGEYGYTVASDVAKDCDWQFIAASRTAIPEMADYIKRLEDAVIANAIYQDGVQICKHCERCAAYNRELEHDPGCIVAEILEARG